LHAGTALRLAGLLIGSLERKAKPGAISVEPVIVDDDTDVGPLLTDFGDLRRIGLARHRPVAVLIVADVMFANAARHEIELALMPNAFPAVKERVIGVRSGRAFDGLFSQANLETGCVAWRKAGRRKAT
jgi:hypothetical protein